jgi:hypothetical protein
MIKATELQIGDFVIVDGTPRKVEAITKKKIGYHRKENEPRLYYARLHDVEPIPLDEKLVLKLGFTKRDASDLMEDYYIHAMYDIRIGEEPFFNNEYGLTEFEEGGYFTFAANNCYWTTMPITHLHTLQHCFRLCGVNFEVKL